jgi:ribonucleoside-diphosphate reductase alpha chain
MGSEHDDAPLFEAEEVTDEIPPSTGSSQKPTPPSGSRPDTSAHATAIAPVAAAVSGIASADPSFLRTATNGNGNGHGHGNGHGVVHSNGSGTSAKSATVVIPRAIAARQARLKGYEGDPCNECGQFMLVRNGTCLKCDGCGTTTGCS